MVCASRRAGDFRTVFSRPRTLKSPGAHDDARGRGRDAGVVHALDATRSGSRLQLRLSTAAEEKMAEVLRAYLARRNTDNISAAAVQPQLRRALGGLVRAGAFR